MFASRTWISVIFAATFLKQHHGLAQFAPYDGNLTYTIVDSPYDHDVKVNLSYKKVHNNTCKTAFDSQAQWTGWISTQGEYPTNLFYWLVYAREPTNSLTIWLNGGPGGTSMSGFFTGVGPCEIVEKGAGRLETAAREWGWDRASHMLFIDQPNQVGFSYDIPVNRSVDFQTGDFTERPLPIPNDRNPMTFMNGTFPTRNPAHTANTTSRAAIVMYHSVKVLINSFKDMILRPANYVDISLFAESYGGKYGPVFFDTWERENVKHQTHTPDDDDNILHLAALGIVNGCVDDMIQAPYYPEMMTDNTYGLKLLNPTEAAYYNGSFYQPGGCRDLIEACRNASRLQDPNNDGNITSVNQVCSNATRACQDLLTPYINTFRDPWDIAYMLPNSFPSRLYAEYLNQRDVQFAVGSIVNFTSVASFIPPLFAETGDYQRGPIIPMIGRLLSRGIRVGLMYGDRDFICNWLGGEALSLAIAEEAGGDYASRFHTAGYAPIIVNDSHVGGQVRQFGNLSFSRIFQAGHAVPAYQPETAFQVFARIIRGKDIGTGMTVDMNSYSTNGSTNADRILQTPPDTPAPVCYPRSMNETCTDDALQGLLKGEGVVINGVWYAAYDDWPGAVKSNAPTGPSSGNSNHGATATPTTTPVLTGVFTATSTPKGAANGASSSPSSLLTPSSTSLALGGFVSCFLAVLLVMF